MFTVGQFCMMTNIRKRALLPYISDDYELTVKVSRAMYSGMDCSLTEDDILRLLKLVKATATQKRAWAMLLHVDNKWPI